MSADNPANGPQSPGTQSPGTQAPPPPQSPQAPAGAALATPMAGTPQLSSVGKRLGEYALELVLFIFTLGIGWLVWTFIILGKGQTPAKQLLGMRVVDVDTGQTVSYGKMFVREFPCKILLGIVASVTVIGLILYFWLCWDDRNQELWDKMVGTVVVDD